MPDASRVRLGPFAPLGEDGLLHAARTLAVPRRALRPGDDVGGLVVLAVEPGPGATLADATEIEIVPDARRADAAKVELAVLLDTSESMGIPWDRTHTRLSAARAAVASFLLDPASTVASVTLLEYAREARRAAGPAPPKDLSLPAEPRAKGPSHTADAIDAALAHLAGRSQRGTSQAILLLTDGVGQPDELAEAGARAGRLLVGVHAIVFAPDVDPIFHGLAAASGGTVQQASYPLTIEFVHQHGA